jgi:putative membrane protein
LIAAVVIGLVNGTIGVLLKVITFPLTILTFGLFWLLINALMPSVVGSKAANGGQVKTGQRMWPGTWFFYPIFS